MNKKVLIGIIALILVICALTVVIVSCNDRKSVVGVYRCEVGDYEYVLVFEKDGTYREVHTEFIGTWTKDKNTINITYTNALGEQHKTAYIVGDGVGIISGSKFYEKVK